MHYTACGIITPIGVMMILSPIGVMIPQAVFCNFDLLMMSTCARNMYRHEIKLIVKQILCIKLVNYRDKYNEIHGGQQNVKK